MSKPEICDCANTGSDAINTCQRVIRGRVEPPCDCECHKPTREQKCADLVRAMGWTEILTNCDPPIGMPPPGLGCDFTYLPNPYESADDSRALVAWLAKQERHIQQRFVFAVRDETTDVDLCYELRIMTTPLSVIADAAWLSIQEKQ